MTPTEVTTSVRYCGGRTRRGTSCTRPAGWGTDHVGYGPCKLHLGSVRNVRLAAFKAEVADLAVHRFGAAVDGDPGEMFMALIAEAANNVTVFRSKLGLLAMPGTDKTESAATVGDLWVSLKHATGKETGEAKPHVLWVMYCDERDRLGRLLDRGLALGLKEREVRVAEHTGQVVRDAVVALIEAPELGLSEGQRDWARRAIAAMLRGSGPPELGSGDR